MGNQAGKSGHRSASVFAADRNRKASRTNWTAGVPSPPGRPVVELSSVRVAEHDDESVTDEINLTWAVPQDDGGYPITGYRVEMLDLGSGCWIEITCIEGYEPKCTLSNILYGIMYRFRIIAMNDAGSSTAGEPSDPIVIDVPGVQIAPYFVQMLNDTVALEHEKIEFRVRVLGTPKPTLQWYKDDVEIFPCDRIEMNIEEEGGAVLLKGARLSDSGVIKCVANNVMGKAVSLAQFDIEAAPRLEVPENYSDGLVFRQDEVIRLKVPLVARPPAKVVWFFEDEPISSGTDVLVETTDAYTSLRIQSAKRWHTGEFRIYAENDNGEDAASILVTVTAAPSPPGKPVVIDISETKCTLRWEPSSDDGGADIRHYVVEYHRDVWEVWLKATTAKDCQVVIDGLIPGSRYMFRVKAENIYRLSEASEASDPFDVATLSSESLLRNREMIPKAPKSRSWLDLTDRNSTSYIDSEADFVLDGQQFAPLTEETLAKSKQLWPQENKEDILDRFLKVQKFAELKIPSYDSDGLPSVVAINDEVTPSEASESERAKKMFDDLRQLSNDTTHSPDEEESDENSVTGQKPRRLNDDSNTVSMESLASLIPEEKKEALHKFEMTLREMIEEARALAHTPSLPDSDTAPVSLVHKERLVEVPPAVPPRSPRPERRRSMKSPSAQSTNESIVSVIEMTSTLGRADEMPMPVISVTADEGSLPNSPRAQISPRVDKPPLQHFFGAAEKSVAWRSRPRSLDTSPTRGAFKQPKRPLWRSRDDDDEEETGPTAGDRFRLNMQRMEHSMRGSHPELPSWQQQHSTATPIKHDVTSRDSIAVLPLKEAARPKPLIFSDSQGTLVAEVAGSKPKGVGEHGRGFVPKPIEISIDPTSKVTSANTEAASADALAAYLPKNLPQWFIITYVYSAVLIFILIMANITPDGKLYVYFVALWSLIAYAVLDDDQGFDPIETVVQEFLRK